MSVLQSSFSFENNGQKITYDPIIFGVSQQVAQQQFNDTLRMYGFQESQIELAQQLRFVQKGLICNIQMKQNNGPEARIIVIKREEKKFYSLGDFSIYLTLYIARVMAPKIKNNNSQTEMSLMCRQLAANIKLFNTVEEIAKYLIQEIQNIEQQAVKISFV